MNKIRKYIILCSISSIITTVLSILSLESIYLIVNISFFSEEDIQNDNIYLQPEQLIVYKYK